MDWREGGTGTGWNIVLFNKRRGCWDDHWPSIYKALGIYSGLGHSVISQSKELKGSTTLLQKCGEAEVGTQDGELSSLMNRFYVLELFSVHKKFEQKVQKVCIYSLSSFVSLLQISCIGVKHLL